MPHQTLLTHHIVVAIKVNRLTLNMIVTLYLHTYSNTSRWSVTIFAQLSYSIWCDWDALGLAGRCELSWGQSLLQVEGTWISFANWGWAQQNERRSGRYDVNYTFCVPFLSFRHPPLMFSVTRCTGERQILTSSSNTDHLMLVPHYSVSSSVDLQYNWNKGHSYVESTQLSLLPWEYTLVV